MKCPNCAKDNHDTAKFCTGCGNPLSSVGMDLIEEYSADPEDERTAIIRDFEDEKTEIMYDSDRFESEETVIIDDFENEETVILHDFENDATVLLDDHDSSSLMKEDIPDFDYRGDVPVFKEDVSGTFHDTAYIDHLRALKQLLDDGIITEDEFTRKKQQILGI